MSNKITGIKYYRMQVDVPARSFNVVVKVPYSATEAQCQSMVKRGLDDGDIISYYRDITIGPLEVVGEMAYTNLSPLKRVYPPTYKVV